MNRWVGELNRWMSELWHNCPCSRTCCEASRHAKPAGSRQSEVEPYKLTYHEACAMVTLAEVGLISRPCLSYRDLDRDGE